MVRMSETGPVCLVSLVYLVYLVCLVDLVHLVSFVQPNKPDKPNKPNNSLPMDKVTVPGWIARSLTGCRPVPIMPH